MNSDIIALEADDEPITRLMHNNKSHACYNLFIFFLPIVGIHTSTSIIRLFGTIPVSIDVILDTIESRYYNRPIIFRL